MDDSKINQGAMTNEWIGHLKDGFELNSINNGIYNRRLDKFLKDREKEGRSGYNLLINGFNPRSESAFPLLLKNNHSYIMYKSRDQYNLDNYYFPVVGSFSKAKKTVFQKHLKIDTFNMKEKNFHNTGKLHNKEVESKSQNKMELENVEDLNMSIKNLRKINKHLIDLLKYDISNLGLHEQCDKYNQVKIDNNRRKMEIANLKTYLDKVETLAYKEIKIPESRNNKMIEVNKRLMTSFCQSSRNSLRNSNNSTRYSSPKHSSSINTNRKF